MKRLTLLTLFLLVPFVGFSTCIQDPGGVPSGYGMNSIVQGLYSILNDILAIIQSYESGQSNFAGVTGVDITMSSPKTSTNYRVLITPTEDPAGNLGEVYVDRKTTTSFTVYNSGTAVTGFIWEVKDQ